MPRSTPFGAPSQQVYVTDLSLDLAGSASRPTVDSQWAEQITRQTVSRLKAKVPPVRGLPH